jgi:transposase
MRLHRNARTCPHCRSLIVSRVSDGGQLPRAVAREFRVTERTVRKWLKRFRAGGGGADGSKLSAEPHSSPLPSARRGAA